jgi:hypothetical protein
MEKLKFSTTLKAPKEKVWKVLWDDATYREWTTAFCEGSYALTDNWKEGSEVKFLDPEGSGMISRVAANRPFEFLSFEHLGEIREGVEDRETERIKAWAGAKENYLLTEINGLTKLDVEMDVNDEFKICSRKCGQKLWIK